MTSTGTSRLTTPMAITACRNFAIPVFGRDQGETTGARRRPSSPVAQDGLGDRHGRTAVSPPVPAEGAAGSVTGHVSCRTPPRPRSRNSDWTLPVSGATAGLTSSRGIRPSTLFPRWLHSIPSRAARDTAGPSSPVGPVRRGGRGRPGAASARRRPRAGRAWRRRCPTPHRPVHGLDRLEHLVDRLRVEGVVDARGLGQVPVVHDEVDAEELVDALLEGVGAEVSPRTRWPATAGSSNPAWRASRALAQAPRGSSSAEGPRR